ncbi:hypothetical protein [Streptomyces coeruleorubidus]|uniref:Uncharacterized protein n=1 Tax=Streptomyces coeruleorubidus TaxID=116188 RepID=A0ABZ0KBQ3_STRC4|nr:hypothetical protein [Streptomyces coeruleorubidus]WOT35397.1 hypothetical protein R5U08_15200 [Streptomyces coeruleorubidus]
MRSLLAAILALFLPARGTHRSAAPPPPLPLTPCPPAPVPPPVITCPHPADLITADGMPLVRPYVVEWERERDEHDRRRLQRERRRAAVLATLGQDYVPVPWEVAA